MKTILCNALSGSMLPDNCTVVKRAIDRASVRDLIKVTKDRDSFISAVGYEATATVLSTMLDTNIEANRINVSLTKDDVLIVAQVIGPRLPEGCTVLPKGTQMVFHRYNIIDVD